VRVGTAPTLWFLLESSSGGYCRSVPWHFAEGDRRKAAPGALLPASADVEGLLDSRLVGFGVVGHAYAASIDERRAHSLDIGRTAEVFSDESVLARLRYDVPQGHGPAQAWLQIAKENEAWKECESELERFGCASVDFIDALSTRLGEDSSESEILLRLRPRDYTEPLFLRRSRSLLLTMLYSETAAVSASRWRVAAPDGERATSYRDEASRATVRLEQCEILLNAAIRHGWTPAKLARLIERAMDAEDELHASCFQCAALSDSYFALDRAIARDGIWRRGAADARDSFEDAASALAVLPGGLSPTLCRVVVYALLLSETVAFMGDRIVQGDASLSPNPWAVSRVLDTKGLTAAWNRRASLRLARAMIWRGLLSAAVGVFATPGAGWAVLLSSVFVKPLRHALIGEGAKDADDELLTSMHRACVAADPQFRSSAPTIEHGILSATLAAWPSVVFPVLKAMSRGERALLSHRARERVSDW